MAPSPFPGQTGGLWSARGLQVTAALSSCLLTSYPQGSASSPGPGLTEGFCPAVSCARNLPNCRHPRGAEEQRSNLPASKLSPPHPLPPTPRPSRCLPSLCLLGLTLSLVTRAEARPPQGQADSTALSSLLLLLPPTPTHRLSPAPNLLAPEPVSIWATVCIAWLFFSQGPCLLRNPIPNPWGTPGRRWGCFFSCFRAY